MILSDSPDQNYHVVTGSFASRFSPGGLGVVNFPDNHFTGHTIDEDHVVMRLNGEIPVHFATSASSSLMARINASGIFLTYFCCVTPMFECRNNSLAAKASPVSSVKMVAAPLRPA